MADIDLAAIVGRAVRHQQDLGAAFGQRLADAELAPDVLADRNAEPHAAEIDRPRHVRTGLEDALLVELAIVRQIDLVALGDDLAAIGDDDGIVGAALALQRRADDDARAAVGGIGGKVLRPPARRRQEGRLQHQVLRRIAGDEQLGVEHQVGALAGGIRPRLARLGEIAGDVADSRIELGDGDAQDVGSGFLVMPAV